jgi:hypothetical protein
VASDVKKETNLLQFDLVILFRLYKFERTDLRCCVPTFKSELECLGLVMLCDHPHVSLRDVYGVL